MVTFAPTSSLFVLLAGLATGVVVLSAVAFTAMARGDWGMGWGMVTFDKAGDYSYYCTVHPSRVARLQVRNRRRYVPMSATASHPAMEIASGDMVLTPFLYHL